MEGLQ